MFVQTSRYKTYTRVRLVEFIRQDGKPTTHLIEHIGSARDDIELAVLKARAEARLRELAPQLSLDLFPRHEDSVHQPRVAITSTLA